MKILHIGNVANNAYWNAKLMIGRGHECHVLSPDEYYCMSRPEWEEGDFIPKNLNVFYPDLQEFWDPGAVEPSWFSQGPILLAMDKLLGCDMSLTLEPRDLFLYEVRKRSLLPVWERLWPGHETEPLSQIVESYFGLLEPYRAFCQQYDIVIGYGAGVFIPLVAGVPFFAMEHGTLRDLPWQQHKAGRLCGLAYALAEHVFVTNPDNLAKGVQLQQAGKQADGALTTTFINHPYDEFHPLTAEPDRLLREQLLRELDADLLIFWPTRHDWTPAYSYMDKGNQVLLSAFSTLRRAGIRVGLICCEWGHDVQESRQYLKAAGVCQYVKWFPPLPGQAYYRMCLTADLVADQFALGANGGVTYKAMACGAPVMTYLDPAHYTGLYDELPPVINIGTEADIVGKIGRYYGASRGELTQIGLDSQAWMRRYHRGHETTQTQLDIFTKFLEA